LSKVSVHYDKVADDYDNHYDASNGRDYYSHICDGVISALPKNGKLLDIGCGTGLFMQRYLKTGREAIGIDISQGMIRRAKTRRVSDVALGTAEVLPFRNESFDAVSSLLAFSYFQHPESMLEESFRVLKPGGSLSICTLGRNIFTSMVPAAYRIGEKLNVKRVGMAYFSEHYYKEEEIKKLLEDVGFVDTNVFRRSFAHVDLRPSVYYLSKKMEPFIESRMPYLAFNLCASGRKPEKKE
jgi:ubiquinone/menaquinone biosynthesis C-methylase UbiE